MRARRLTVPVAVAALAVLAGCTGAPTDPGTDAGSPSASATDATGCSYAPSSTAAREVDAPPAEPAASDAVAAVLQTSAGDIPMVLDAERTPCTVNSFLSLAEQGYYDDTSCHRLTTAGIFVLQCGDPSSTGRGGPGYSYADELDGTETYPAGTVAMANAGPDTNGAQFFLVYEDTALPPGYTVFGQLDDAGLDVVRRVAADGTATGASDGPPAETVTITAVALR